MLPVKLAIVVAEKAPKSTSAATREKTTKLQEMEIQAPKEHLCSHASMFAKRQNTVSPTDGSTPSSTKESISAAATYACTPEREKKNKKKQLQAMKIHAPTDSPSGSRASHYRQEKKTWFPQRAIQLQAPQKRASPQPCDRDNIAQSKSRLWLKRRANNGQLHNTKTTEQNRPLV